MKNGGPLHRAWIHYGAAVCRLTGYRGKGMWPWRWICWREGHSDYYGCCVVCGLDMRKDINRWAQ